MGLSSHWTEETRNVWQYTKTLDTQHRSRLAIDQACLRILHPTPDLSGVEKRADGRLVPLSAFNSFRKQGPNLSNEVVGGALAMVVRPMQIKLLPVGGDYMLRQFCDTASTLIDGVCMVNKIEQLQDASWKDAMWGTVGCIKTSVNRKGEIKLSQVSPLSLRWDMYEGKEPLTIIEEHAVPKRVLMTRYPKKADKIKLLPTWFPDPIPGVDDYGMTRPDTVRVIEATAVKIEDKVGLRALVCDGGLVLEKRDFEDEVHDHSFVRWEDDPRKFGGISLVRGVAPYHAAMIRFRRMRHEAMKGCIPVIFKHIDDEVFKNIGDLEYHVQEYDGTTPPKIEIAGKTDAAVNDEEDNLRRRAYEENGVSFNVSTGVKPAGVNSAPGQREWLETQNLRTRRQEARGKQQMLDIGNAIARKGSRAYQSKGLRVGAPGTRFLNEIKWPKDLKEDQYQAQADAVSGLSLTTTGKIDQVEVLTNLGVFDAEDAAEQMAMPDNKRKRELTLAPRELAAKQIYNCLEKAKYDPPSPHQETGRALKMANLEYQRALAEGVREKDGDPGYPRVNFLILRRYIRRCEYFEAAKTPPAQAAGVAADPNAPSNGAQTQPAVTAPAMA